MLKFFYLQAKLDKDIMKLEVNHQATKNRIVDRSEKFIANYDSVQTTIPLPDEKYIEDLTEKYYQEMKAQQQEAEKSESDNHYARYRPYDMEQRYCNWNATSGSGMEKIPK
jgi:hypothetical protein